MDGCIQHEILRDSSLQCYQVALAISERIQNTIRTSRWMDEFQRKNVHGTVEELGGEE